MLKENFLKKGLDGGRRDTKSSYVRCMYSHHQQEILSKKGSGRRPWGHNHRNHRNHRNKNRPQAELEAGKIPPNHTQKSPPITVKIFIPPSQPSPTIASLASLATIASHISSESSHAISKQNWKTDPQADFPFLLNIGLFLFESHTTSHGIYDKRAKGFRFNL